jgi:hypothetical protein
MTNLEKHLREQGVYLVKFSDAELPSWALSQDSLFLETAVHRTFKRVRG